MLPLGELSGVELHRAQIRDRIGLRRRLTELQLAELAKPVHHAERLLGTWRRVAPIAAFAAIPVALFAGRGLRIFRWFGPLLRVAPIALAFARSRRARPPANPVRP
jgi:hypothetical protein